MSKGYEQNPLCVTEGMSMCHLHSSDNKLALTLSGQHWGFQGHFSPQDLAYLPSQAMGTVTAHGTVVVSLLCTGRALSQLTQCCWLLPGQGTKAGFAGYRGRSPGHELFSGQRSALCSLGKEELI